MLAELLPVSSAVVLSLPSFVAASSIEAEPVSEELAIARKGLSAGERVVVDGQSRLDQGARVAIRAPNPSSNAVKHEADKS